MFLWNENLLETCFIIREPQKKIFQQLQRFYCWVERFSHKHIFPFKFFIVKFIKNTFLLCVLFFVLRILYFLVACGNSFFCLNLSQGYKDSKKPHPLHSLASGLGSGIFSAVLVTPADVVKTRLQVLKRMEGEPVYTGWTDAVKKIYRNEGASAFFKGALTRAIVVAPLFGIAQMVYIVGFAEHFLEYTSQPRIKDFSWVCACKGSAVNFIHTYIYIYIYLLFLILLYNKQTIAYLAIFIANHTNSQGIFSIRGCTEEVYLLNTILR